MSVSNYVLNQRISYLQYQIDNLGPDFKQNLDNVLFQGNSTGDQSIVNNDDTFILSTASNSSSLEMIDGTNNMILSATDLVFNGTSIVNPPTTKTLINIISTADFVVNTSNVYYTSALKNGIVYLIPNVAQVNITILNALSIFNFAVLVNIPNDEDYYFKVWSSINNEFSSTQVYFSCNADGFLTLNLPYLLDVGSYTLNLPSFSYIVS